MQDLPKLDVAAQTNRGRVSGRGGVGVGASHEKGAAVLGPSRTSDGIWMWRIGTAAGGRRGIDV